MAGMLEYKCPCCDGAIKFDSTTQKLKCPYCDTEFEVDALKGYDKDLKDQKPSEMDWATPGGSRRLEVQLRRSEQGSLLLRVRQTQARRYAQI